MSNHIFISHSSKDKLVATAVVEALEESGAPCWLASRDVGIGEQSAKAVGRAIETCSLLLLIFSSKSNNSAHVLSEAEQAVNFKKTVVVFRVEDVDLSRSMEAITRRSHWFNPGPGQWRESLANLVIFVKKILSGGKGVDAAQVDVTDVPRFPDTAVLAYTDTQADHRIQIWNVRECRLGRNSLESDLLCWVLPASPANDRKTAMVGKVHCRILVRNGQVYLKDENSRNGTFVDGRRLTRGKATVLNPGQVISLADAVFFEYHEFRSDAGQNGISAGADPAVLEAFRLKLLHQGSEVIEHLFLLESATLGTDASAAVRLVDDSVSKLHGRFILHEGRLYLEDFDSRQGTRVGGRLLDPWTAQPVGESVWLRLGNLELDMRFPE